jgi:hypothetical protein
MAPFGQINACGGVLTLPPQAVNHLASGMPSIRYGQGKHQRLGISIQRSIPGEIIGLVLYYF